jgi:hypothetical protein
LPLGKRGAVTVLIISFATEFRQLPVTNAMADVSAGSAFINPFPKAVRSSVEDSFAVTTLCQLNARHSIAAYFNGAGDTLKRFCCNAALM